MKRKHEDYLKKLLVEYAHSILQLVDGIKSSNVNQVLSLIRANNKVLENDIKKSFNTDITQDYARREYN